MDFAAAAHGLFGAAGPGVAGQARWPMTGALEGAGSAMRHWYGGNAKVRPLELQANKFGRRVSKNCPEPRTPRSWSR
jgi:hypothetical protein